MTPKELAYSMGVSLRTVRRWIASGYVQTERIGPRGHIKVWVIQ